MSQELEPIGNVYTLIYSLGGPTTLKFSYIVGTSLDEAKEKVIRYCAAHDLGTPAFSECLQIASNVYR